MSWIWSLCYGYIREGPCSSDINIHVNIYIIQAHQIRGMSNVICYN